MTQIYIASPLSNSELNARVESLISELGFTCFLPQRDTPQGERLNRVKGVFKSNVNAINNSEIVLAIGHCIGNDTSWELGYSFAIKKVTTLLIDEADFVQFEKSSMILGSFKDILLLPTYLIDDNNLKKKLQIHFEVLLSL